MTNVPWYNFTHPPNALGGATTPRKKKGKPKPKPTPRPTQPQPITISTPLYTPYALGPIWGYDQHAPKSQEIGLGYDVNAASIQGDRRTAALNQANGFLLSGQEGFNVPIFVSTLTLDTALGGSDAQSRFTRDFYPRSFTQPSFVITGQSLDQEDYGLMCEFIHYAQRRAVGGGFNDLTQLFVVGRDRQKTVDGRGFDGRRRSGGRVMLSNPGLMASDTNQGSHTSDPAGALAGSFYNQTMRGAHQAIIAKGYVTSMPRIHQRFEYAVEWQFGFVVASMIQGPYQDPATGPAQAQTTWLDMLNDIKKSGVFQVTPDLQKQNQAILLAAQGDTSIYANAGQRGNDPNAYPGGSTGPSGTAGSTSTTGPRPKGGYQALVDSNLVFAGVDQGIDFTGGPGHVYALADGVTSRAVASGSGWPGSPGSLYVYRCTGGSHKGRYIYTAEDFDIDTSLLATGTPVKQGQSIGVANGKAVAPGIECGFADPDGQASAHAPSSGPTGFGHEFEAYVKAGGG